MQGTDTATAATARSNEAAGMEMLSGITEMNVDDLCCNYYHCSCSSLAVASGRVKGRKGFLEGYL